ncbi:hypothetical protein RIF29_41945 [Crotalaria pallida]|uniref:RING-type E3 ubiquitin transferase n=1 Tax=Crotalaria pallida TaxID=3830 RepID=A0AAN9E609_CROPI
MASIPFQFSLGMSSTPLEEADMRPFQLARVLDIGDFFNIKIQVRNKIIRHHSELEFSYNTSMILSCPQLFELGFYHMCSHLPPNVVPQVLLLRILPQVRAYAQSLRFRRDLRGEDGCRFFNLVLDIEVRRMYEDIVNMITEESTVREVPIAARKIALESIEKVILEKDNMEMMMERCSICLEEFNGGAEVSSLPCKHVYHGECITKWLERNHTCPLCRYPMSMSTQ